MADKEPELHLKRGEDGLYIDEEDLLDEDAAKALQDLEAALSDEAETVGFGQYGEQIVIDVPPVDISIAKTPIKIDVPPVDIMPMIMIGMMMA